MCIENDQTNTTKNGKKDSHETSTECPKELSISRIKGFFWGEVKISKFFIMTPFQ